MQTLKLILPIGVGLFFVFFGIHLLISSYNLNDPFSFVITFFASNLMILISIAISLGYAIKLRRLLRGPAKKDQE